MLLVLSLAVANTLPACTGRVPAGRFLPIPDQMAFEVEDTVVPPDSLSGDGPSGEMADLSGEWLVPDWSLDIQPDVPPLPCQTDADCPPTGLEPCYRSLCSLDEETGLMECRSAQDTVCADAPQCQVAKCVPGSGCIEVKGPNGEPCDDEDPCTTDDSCKAGVCTGTLPDCDDGNPCTADLCDGATGLCYHLNVPTPCDDGSICTEGDQCVAGKCIPGAAVSCDDSDLCTTDACNPVSGCAHAPIAGCCSEDGDCSDTDLCTYDHCALPEHSCQHVPVACQDDSKCTQDSCSPAQGCQFIPIEGCCLVASDCDDADVCTIEWCGANQCQWEKVACADQNPCTQDQCNAVTGCVFTKIPGCCLADSDCWDGSLCVTAACENNKCSKTEVSCDDGNACTKDGCDPAKGCTYLPVAGCCTGALQCNDGDPCTEDLCVANACQHKPKLTPECCNPSCSGKQCGPDGCGGFCGNCPDDLFCDQNGKCQSVCTPSCTGKQCGPDGCGTFCGTCVKPQVCSDAGQCVACVPKCGGKSCGDDGCGGACGFCPAGQSCDTTNGLCKLGCTCTGAGCWQDGFESGQLAGWTLDGDAEVIHNMGVTEAPQGWYMAFVGSGLSELELGKVQKTFCPPASAKFIGFKWKHYSEEFKEWCGTIYQDKFHVVVANGTQELELLSLTVDDLCPPDACAGCGKKYVGLEQADVKFDQGDVWMTPWSVAYYQLPDSFIGKPITVTFSVSDVGDMIYVTAILIDAVQFL